MKCKLAVLRFMQHNGIEMLTFNFGCHEDTDGFDLGSINQVHRSQGERLFTSSVHNASWPWLVEFARSIEDWAVTTEYLSSSFSVRFDYAGLRAQLIYTKIQVVYEEIE